MKYTVASLTVVALLSGNAMAQRKPNIILFLVDDMGWQDTSLPFWKDTTDLNRIYLEDGTLVGHLLPAIDGGLGKTQKLQRRLSL